MSDILKAGITAAQAGDKSHASSLLSEAVRQNPRSDQAWLWLGRCLDDPQRQGYCFRRALELNPLNREAVNALRDLRAARFAT